MFLSLQFCLDSLLSSPRLCDNTWSTIFSGNLDTDIAILGNSRAEVHYNPNIITKITDLKSYNLGLSGTPLNILNIRWTSYINRNKKPKVLILDVDYNVLGTADGVYEKFQYLPYIKETEYSSVAKNIDESLTLDCYVPLYKYRGFGMEIYRQIKSMYLNNCNAIENGFKVNNNLWNNNEWNNFKANRVNEIEDTKTFIPLYENGITELKEILDYCSKNNILVFMIWSPQYYEVHNFKKNQRKYVDSLLMRVAKQYKIDYLNFSNDSLVYDKSNFYNHSHLNAKGSEAFSKKVGKLISEIIKK